MTNSAALYDDPRVTAEYDKVPRGSGLHAGMAISAKNDNGAAKVHRIDNSASMLRKAQELHGGQEDIMFE
ncbi:hypothetical protein EYZ11_005832 [Aspergillus tanneri]|uniref:Uncharacterized protein n=1 Tax=Aspergillus tanneri TaxID=1220188 RepID=A0A4S3JJB6_9EURO|nr:uncharacterized protein ATNIH1004_003576 [Aspergillus tanneri]KAA8650887.1 hypothetical protein ATNIH1004_003576 [Aspergillus tanneri]THC94687.1 hypothetical protein EYZ11_005832 [Aspergillus tanneri]